MKEKGIQDSIIQYLKLKRLFCYRNNSGAMKTERGGFLRFGCPGSPDIIVVQNGKYIGLEVKTEKGVQSDSQKEFETALKMAGGEYHLVRSLDEVIVLFNKQ